MNIKINDLRKIVTKVCVKCTLFHCVCTVDYSVMDALAELLTSVSC